MEKSKRKVQFMDFCVQKFVKISLCKLKEELPESDLFFELVYHGDLKGVKTRQEGLEKDIQYIRDKAGWSLMHYAVLCGHVSLVKYFCKLSLDPNIPCDVTAHGVKKWRPIHIAAETGNTELLRVLLEAGANAELFVEGRTNNSNRSSVGSSKQSSSTINGGNEGDTINSLGLAVLSQRTEAVRVLLEHKVFVDPRTAAHRKTPLMLAASRPNADIVRLLLEYGARVNATTENKNLTPLHYAAKGGHAEIVKVLLEANASANARSKIGVLPIHMAAFFTGSRLPVLELLYEHAPDTLESVCDSERDPFLEAPAYDQTPLVLAFISKVTPKFDFLLDRGGNINKLFDVGKIKGMNMLRYLVECRNVDLKMVDTLINNGIDINNVASDKMTPLMYATVKNLQPLVARLVAAGADPNFRDENGYTALILAVKQRYNSLVTLILDLKPNLDASIVFTDKKGNKYHECTALHLAVGKGNLEVTKQLVAAGADITTTMEASGEREGPDYGEAKVSCLHTAVVMNHFDIGKFLIEQGLDPNLTTSRGHTPLHYAASWGHADFAELLIKHGAQVDAVADRNCSIPLHYAARANLTDMAELLLENGSNVRTVNAKGFTALHFALTFGHVGMAELLLRPKYGADVNVHSGVVEHRSHVSPLVLALEYCDVATVENLLRRGADPNAEFKANNMTLSPIFLCCEFGHVDKMRVLMKYGANINHQSSRGETPLHFALRFKRKEAAELLIRSGANLDARASIGNGEMQQPFHVAAQVGIEELMPLMAQYGACVNSTMVLKSVERVTPLHLAALNDLQCSVRVLLLLGADVNCKRSDTFTPLLTMVSKSNTEAVDLLLRAGAEVNAKCVVSRSKDATCLHIAAQVGIPEIISLLLRYGADVTARMTTGERSGILPIHLAAESGHINVIRRFLREGVSIDVQEDCGLTCLHYAANGGKKEIVRMLIKRGANVSLTATYDDGNRVDVMPLHMAAEKGFADCVRLLLDYGAPINATISRNRRSGITPLYLAVAENREEVVRVLVEYGADTNVQDSIGANPLHIACQRGYENMVFYLLALGNAGVNVGTHNGATALHMVAEKGYTDLAAWLLRAGAEVNVRCLIVDVNTKKTSFNITPLNQACGFGHAKIVQMLLAAGADPYAGENFEGEDGITALHCAAIRGRVHIVPILVDYGVDPNVRDEKGNTPLHWAVRECFYDCCEILVEHGANVTLRNKNDEKPSDLAKSNDILGLLRNYESSSQETKDLRNSKVNGNKKKIAVRDQSHDPTSMPPLFRS